MLIFAANCSNTRIYYQPVPNSLICIHQQRKTLQKHGEIAADKHLCCFFCCQHFKSIFPNPFNAKRFGFVLFWQIVSLVFPHFCNKCANSVRKHSQICLFQLRVNQIFFSKPSVKYFLFSHVTICKSNCSLKWIFFKKKLFWISLFEIVHVYMI